MSTAPVFTLQFAESEIATLVERYAPDQDNDAFAAGASIAKGDYSRKNLETIFRWKTNDRGKTRLLENTDEEITDALGLAVAAKTPRAALAVLTGLSGVGIPVATAVLTVTFPDRYTIIDWRVMEALGHYPAPTITLKLYLSYFDTCRSIASRNGVSLRNLDRAMWQWSKDRGVKR